MTGEKKRKIGLAGLLSVCLTFMQIAGWQISMKYGTSVHQSAFLQKIGVLGIGQVAVLGIVEFGLFACLIYRGFSWLDKQESARRSCPVCDGAMHLRNTANSGESGEGKARELPKYFWIGVGAALFLIYLVFLVGCYPGFYCYDVGTQIPQMLYREVPFDAHHPLLHTIVEGGIIAVGYRIHNADLTFGIFLYCLFQMLVCAVCLAYALRFIYRLTGRKGLTALAFCFYAFCPPVVMCAMSTTKDILCYILLLVAVLRLYEIYRDMEENPPKGRSLVLPAVLMVLSCLFRNNVIYGIIVFAFAAVLLVKRCRKAQALFYGSVIVLYFVVNKGMIYATKATPASITEALSVPLQQIARLYEEKGKSAFTEEELELLYAGIDEGMLHTYDPFISDNIKYAFWCNIDVIMERKGEFIGLWAKKGLQYPGLYLASFLDNTYQAWYPGTVVIEGDGYKRYYLIPDWRDTEDKPYTAKPLFPWLYDYYKSLNDEFSYIRYPFLRLFFETGTMIWTALITWFYGLWRKKREVLCSLGLVLLVSATSLCGPVSDVRYYLILFYMFPLCVGFLLGGAEDRP